MADMEFERQCTAMGHFIQIAEVYVQFSVGALVLTVTSLHEIAGVPKE